MNQCSINVGLNIIDNPFTFYVISSINYDNVFSTN
jgi:hypothetical protein